MRAGAEHGVPVVVLDRPNPIGGEAIDGTVLDAPFVSFVGAGPIAMRYGLTIGELGLLFNAELGVGADLSVVPMQGWRRAMWLDQTRLEWVNPSPNLRSLDQTRLEWVNPSPNLRSLDQTRLEWVNPSPNLRSLDQTRLEWVNPSPNLRSLGAATVYPGTVLFEGTTLTEGRGTDRPFEWIGAPWINGAAWADALNSLALADESLSGVRFSAARRTPSADSAKFPGMPCDGVLVEVTDRQALAPMAAGVAMVQTALQLAPGKAQITPSTFDRLAGTDALRKALEQGTPAKDIAASWRPALSAFEATRKRYFLY